jgi:formylglycine-generating enzyme required for sulfatase activity
MRKIPAKDFVWQIGSPADELGRAISDSETQKYVKLTQDFYIGVFEITQAQFMKVYKGEEVNTPVNPSTFECGENTGYLPVNNVSYSMLRGNLSYTGPSGEKVNWPTNSYLHEVVTAYTRPSFLRDLRRVCKGVEFDLPFDPQWEFACRAGVYDKGLNDGLGLRSGAAESDRLDKLGWYSNNSGSAPHPVGMLRPNAFGLYDMHGNAYEVLANWAGNVVNPTSGSGESADDPMVDPVGATATSGARTARGGGYDAGAYYCRNASRFSLISYHLASAKQGFRVVCPVGTKWEE